MRHPVNLEITKNQTSIIIIFSKLIEKRGTLSVDPKSNIVKSNASDSDRVAAMKTAKSDATGLKDGQSEHERQQLSAFLQV